MRIDGRYMSRDEIDRRVLRHLTTRRTVETINRLGSKATTVRLLDAGLVARDPKWTGCLTLTDAGWDRVELDEEMDR